MATNKNAIIRYQSLDRSFRNPGRKYFIEDLVEACSLAIQEFSGSPHGVQRRQVLADIVFMESEQGWAIPLERIKEGKRVYYRYGDPEFSINNQPFNEADKTRLREVLLTLSRFKGMPQFEWIEELQVRLESLTQIQENALPAVGFQENPYLKGLGHFSELFHAIKNETPLKLIYAGFRQKKPEEIVFHPWYLKQYNNRWFVFGYNEGYNGLSNFALDRIISFSDYSINYKKNTLVDFSEYFEDVIGVTVKQDAEPQKILIRIDNKLWPYIESKPLHGSQKVKERTGSSKTIEIAVQINYELISLLLSYGESLEVMAPDALRTILKEKVNAMAAKYF
jgi:predicted DNA-binding transcriptional regulator YafY